MPVDLVTVHHEGAGAPTDTDRYSEGGYTYGIGLTRWLRFRTVASSYATLNFNHVSMDVCLSGNRMDYPVTDTDLDLMHGAFMDCYARGEVDAVPTVRAHKNSPGSSTVCPGDQTMARWSQVVECFRLDAPTPTPPPTKGAPLTTVAFGPNQPNGRTPTARPDIDNGVVLLENGARVDGDKPGPNAGPETRYTWRHEKVQADAKLVDIAARADAFVALYRQSDGRVVTFQAYPR